MNTYLPVSPLKSKLVAGLILAAALCFTAAAQTSVSFADTGLNYPTPGMPFQAEATLHSTQRLGDGTVIVKEVHVTLARDDQGRFSFVSHSIQPVDHTESHIVLDPVGGRELSWSTLSKSVTTTPIRANSHITVSVLPRERDVSSTLPADEKAVTNEELGSKAIAGIPVVGTRTVTTIAASHMGSDRDIVIRHEQWIAPDLQLIVAESDDNPFGATRTYEITSFERSAPAESLFQPPPDLPLQTRTLPPIAPPSMGTAAPVLGDIFGVMGSTTPASKGTAPPPSDLSSLLAIPDSPPSPTIPPGQQAPTAEVTRLLQLIHPPGQVQSVMKALPLPIPNLIMQQFQTEVRLMTMNRPDALTPEQEATLAVLRDKYEQKALTVFSTDDLIADLTPIYQRHLTRADIEAYIAFYSSPAGQRLIDFQPVMEKESMPLTMRRIVTDQKQLEYQMKKDIDACINPAAPAPASLKLAPEQREKQIPIALSSTDPSFKNSVAYALANSDSHLTDAQTLAEDAVRTVEQETANIALKGDKNEDYKQSVTLSSYWDTLGWVYYRQGKQEKAEAYILAAWNLKPNAEYALHLGSIYEAQLRPKDAVAIYRMALSGKNSPIWQNEFQTRLAKLGESHAEPVPMEVSTSLQSSVHPLGLGATEPVVDILIASAGPPVVTYIEGEPAHGESLTHAIQSAVGRFLPDSGPETVLRRARVTCMEGEASNCVLHFLTPSSEKTPPSAPPPSKQ